MNIEQLGFNPDFLKAFLDNLPISNYVPVNARLSELCEIADKFYVMRKACKHDLRYNSRNMFSRKRKHGRACIVSKKKRRIK